MSITERIAGSFGRLRSLLSKKEKIMSDQTVIENSATTATPDASTLSPLESFANEVAVPVASSAPAADASTAAVSSAAGQVGTTSAVSSAPAPDVSTPAESNTPAPDVSSLTASNVPALDTSTLAANAGSEAQVAADATDLTQQLATPDPLANGSASAGPSSASTVGILAEQPAVGVITDAVSQDINASVKDFTQAFNFVESGVEKLGAAAKDELIALARKYL
ncbi:hypothetical protein NH00_09620 [Enterobacter cancerogenus]|nr:hypothetical protein NH00_09620 [Enterobacter cancerogenus]